MGYRQVMDLPINTFWFMNHAIHRIMAEQNLRDLTVMNSAQSGEGAEQCRTRLIVEMGEVVKESPLAAQRDYEGFEQLRMM